ncbi:MAG: alpha/beta fold hydrolase [Candidatus Dormibacteraeota bacterium]|jgi:poly(3-hydroxyalkanoate) depolymerase|nr:alpha/beta fold hydrolase [Candidatus Dormibacteraeota bacterium]
MSTSHSGPSAASGAGSGDGAATRFVTVEGIRLRVRIEGSGEPLLLVMGIGGNIEMWAPLIGALKGRQTIAFDAPGTGESALPKRPLRIKDLARIAGRLLDQLDYGQVDVLGVSFGGAIAQQLAFQEPERVRKLILAATACGIGGVPGNPLTMAILLTPFRYYSRTYLELVAPYLYGRGGGDDGLSQQQRLARLHRPPNMLGYYFQMAAMAGWTSLPFLRRISQPTLVMAGTDDRILPLVNGRMLARLIPGARLYIVEDGGHLFLLDRARESAEAIQGFLGQAPVPEGDGR